MKIVEIEVELHGNGERIDIDRGLFMTEAKFNSMSFGEIVEEVKLFVKDLWEGYELASWDYQVIEVLE